jgi:hypothetical protein
MKSDEPLGLDFVVQALRRIKPKKMFPKGPPLVGGKPAVRSDRWGPGLEDNEPGITTSKDWRWWVAGLPHEPWRWWERRWWEIREQRAKEWGRPLNVSEITDCKYQAYLELIRGT